MMVKIYETMCLISEYPAAIPNTFLFLFFQFWILKCHSHALLRGTASTAII